ncbi:MAG: 3-methyl-2-oxobutanoate hydroxymethyltransferase [Thermoguttaceae bacterium]|nr:3-methyl-2-oxobutanoate hydroxymethyltransferase [Thermoguttaceae bacterium]
MMSHQPHPTKLTPACLAKMRAEGTKISMMTVYDYTSARLLDQAGVDVLLVGDSLGMVVQGKENTLPVTLEEMIYHTEMVARAADRAIVIADLPFPVVQLGVESALNASVQIIKRTRATGVKVEGGENRVPVIRALLEAGIPVMGHCGLLPQDIRRLGGYKIQRNTETLRRDVRAVADSGVMAIVLECVTADLAGEITREATVPTIGIGSGSGCDGQVLVFHDMLGFTDPGAHLPKHARRYAHLGEVITDAARRYIADVRSGSFPGPDESF